MLSYLIISHILFTLLFLVVIFYSGFKNSLNKSLLFKSFLSGIISAFFYTLISLLILTFSKEKISYSGNTALIITVTTEELFKSIFIIYWINKNDSIKLFQLFIICSATALGFSFIENIFYYLAFDKTNLTSGFVMIRSILLPLMHMTATIIFGYFIFKGKKENFAYNFILGLLLSSLVHYSWNILL
ncbi:MAG: PrsW family intramembrane metalloprotease [Ignavibacteriales bacterium]|nr:MAG: PrsW family intramembrane metalloprotease [Ignavibacteriales bacterium]